MSKLRAYILSKPSKNVHTISVLKENIPKPSTFVVVLKCYIHCYNLEKIQNYLTSLRPDLIKNPSNSCAFLVHIQQMEFLLNLTFNEATSLWITLQTSSHNSSHV